MKLSIKVVLGLSVVMGAIFTSCGTTKSLEVLYSTDEIARSIYSAVMTNDSKGIACGEKGKLLYSEDRGQTWIDSGNRSPCLQQIYVIDDDKSIMAADIWTIAFTSDCGKSCVLLPENPVGMPYGITMKDDSYGYLWDQKEIVVVQPGKNGYSKISRPSDARFIEAILCIDEGHALLCDTEGFIYETVDNGQNWSKLTQVFDAANDKVKPVVKNLVQSNTFSKDGDEIRFASYGRKDYVNHYLTVYISRDGGKTFEIESRTDIGKEAKAVTFNRHKEISVLFTDLTLSVYKIN